MFRNLGPDYYGDLDEQDGKVLEYETKREQQGKRHFCGCLADGARYLHTFQLTPSRVASCLGKCGATT